MIRTRFLLNIAFIVLLLALIQHPNNATFVYATTETPVEPPSSSELIARALSFEEAGSYKEANQVYRSLSHLSPRYAHFCLYAISRNQERDGETGKALRGYIKLLTAMSKVESPDFDINVLTSVSLEAVFLLGDTYDSVERYLDRFSRFFPASSYYAVLLDLKRGDAKEAAQTCLAIFESDLEPYNTLLLQKLPGERAVIDILGRKGIGVHSLIEKAMERKLYDEALSLSYLVSDSSEILRVRALSFYKLRDYDAALPLYLKYYEETNDPDALLKLAHISFSKSRRAQAEEYLDRYISYTAADPALKGMNREAAFLQMQLAVQSGRARSSLSVVRDFLHTYEGSRYADIVATTAFYNALQRGYLSQGLDFINEVQVQLHTEYYQAWAAYILGIYSDPEQLFRAMELRPGSYYSFRASHLLEKETEPVLNDALTGMYSLKSVEDSVLYELCSSGYVNEIEDMIQTALALAGSETKPGYLFLLSRLYYMKGDPYRGITYAEKLLHSLGSPDLVSLPRPVLELLYPKVFGAEIAAVLKQRETEIEPCLVLAIVREESRYNSSARSTKGAMGLMQLMPATASWIMRDDISPIDLRKPVVNISAGTAYLNYLFSRFDRTEHVVASYNGGPNIVAQWVRKNKGKPMEIFIEEIPYRETRNFVKRVYTSYQMYRLLYGDYEVLVD